MSDEEIKLKDYVKRYRWKRVFFKRLLRALPSIIVFFTVWGIMSAAVSYMGLTIAYADPMLTVSDIPIKYVVPGASVLMSGFMLAIMWGDIWPF